jgi:molybdopterin-guanine dinucleotide biosynthesis protein B
VNRRRAIGIRQNDGCDEASGMRMFGFAGWSGSGKTTLIERLIPRLTARGLRVSLIKHAHHSFDIDHEGKDSWRHRRAGCTEVLVASRARFALMHELRDEPEPSLPELAGRLAPCDLVLVEGYKWSPIPKLEVYRASVGKPKLHPRDPHIRAVATDDPGGLDLPLPVFSLDGLEPIASFVVEQAVLPQDPGGVPPGGRRIDATSASE